MRPPPYPRDLIPVVCVLVRLIEVAAPSLLEQVKDDPDQRVRLEIELTRLDREITRLLAPTPYPDPPLTDRDIPLNRLHPRYVEAQRWPLKLTQPRLSNSNATKRARS